MTTGLSGTYAINGTDLTLQPSSGRWLKREVYGVDGGGHDVVPAFREFELEWETIPPADASQLTDLFITVSSTGTVVFDLPKYGDSTFTFYRYSGTVISEPELGNSFMNHWISMRLLVRRIRT